MKINAKRRGFDPFIIVSAFIIAALGIFTVITAINISETSAAIVEEEWLYEKNKERLARLQVISDTEDELRKEYERLNRLLPAQADEVGLIRYINELAIASGMVMEAIEFDDRVVNNSINVIPMKVSLKGTYSQLASLMKDIAEGERLVRFEEIEIKRGNTDADGISVSIKANAFFR